MKYLVGGLEHGWIMNFPRVGMMIQSDELIFFRGVGLTTNQIIYITIINHIITMNINHH
jgi:hypothetical protein